MYLLKRTLTQSSPIFPSEHKSCNKYQHVDHNEIYHVAMQQILLFSTGFLHPHDLCVCVCVCLNCASVYTLVNACSVVDTCSLRASLCVSFQESNPYSTVAPDPTELDCRYCVLQLNVPYSALKYSPDKNTGWDSNTFRNTHYAHL